MAKKTSSFQAQSDSRSRPRPGGQKPSTERPPVPPASVGSAQGQDKAVRLSWPPTYPGLETPEWLGMPRGDYPPDTEER